MKKRLLAVLLGVVLVAVLLPTVVFADSGDWTYDSGSHTLTNDSDAVLYNVTVVDDSAKTLCIGENKSFTGALDLSGTISDGSGNEWEIVEIADYAFDVHLNADEALTGPSSIKLPETLTTIGRYAFYGCDELASVVVPDSVTSIGPGAFYSCKGLQEVTLPDTLQSIPQNAFAYCDKLEKINMPSELTSIGESAFANCKALETVIIPDTVTSIGNSAFIGCSSLATVQLPSGLSTLSGGMFKECTSLTNITLPASIGSIGDQAFEKCSSLSEITVLATTPPEVGTYNVFTDTALSKIYVPAESQAAYMAASGWSDFSDKITPLSITGEMSVSPDGYTFSELTEGYAEAELSAAEFTITNGRNVPLNNIKVTLGGADADSFALDTSSTATSLAANITTPASTTFSVKPNGVLAAGTYTATLTISADGVAAINKTISFTVNKDTSIYVGNVKLSGTAEAPVYATTDDEGTVTIDPSLSEDDAWNIKYDGSTLTLYESNISGSSDQGRFGSAIYAESDLEIMLDGTHNHVTGVDSTNGDSMGIYVDGQLKITSKQDYVGRIVLNVGKAATGYDSYGIFSTNGIIVENGVYYISSEGGSAEDGNSYGIATSNGDIIINRVNAMDAVGGSAENSYGLANLGSGDIKITNSGNEYAGPLEMIGGTATNESIGIYAQGDVVFTSQVIAATGNTAAIDCANFILDAYEQRIITLKTGDSKDNATEFGGSPFDTQQTLTMDQLNCKYLYAEAAQYWLVSFNANGGSGEPIEGMKVDDGDSIVFPECTFDPPSDNQRFRAWAKDSPDGEQYGLYGAFDSCNIYADTVFYVVWEDIDIEVGGVALTYAGAPVYATVDTDGQVTVQPTYNESSDWHIKYERDDSGNDILTLRNAKIINNTTDKGIYAKGNLTIVLQGENSVASSANNQMPYGIYVEGQLTIREDGSGSLDVKTSETVNGNVTQSFGVYSRDEINIESGNISVQAGDIVGVSDIGVSYGVFGQKNISISGGTLDAKSGDTTESKYGHSWGIYCLDNLLVIEDGAVVTATSGDSKDNSVAVFAYEIQIKDAQVITKSGNTDTGYSYGIYAYDGITIEKSHINVTTGDQGEYNFGIVNMASFDEDYTGKSLSIIDSELIINTGASHATTESAGSVAIMSNSWYYDQIAALPIIIDNSQITANAGRAEGVSSGIYVEGNTLTISGENTDINITSSAAGANSYGIAAVTVEQEEGSITISGGKVVANGETSGIFSSDGLSIDPQTDKKIKVVTGDYYDDVWELYDSPFTSQTQITAPTDRYFCSEEMAADQMYISPGKQTFDKNDTNSLYLVIKDAPVDVTITEIKATTTDGTVTLEQDKDYELSTIFNNTVYLSYDYLFGLAEGQTVTLTTVMSNGEEFTAEIVIPETYTIDFISDPEDIGQAYIDARYYDTYYLLVGDQLTVEAAGGIDYTFVRWSDGETELSTNPELTITPDKDMTLTMEFVANVYGLEADPDTLNFGTERVGYTQPEAQQVTITNTGDQELKLSASATDNYLISAFSQEILQPGDNATFTIQPKAGLRAGNYHETIMVYGDTSQPEALRLLSTGDDSGHKAAVAITVDFTVIGNGSGSGRNCTLTFETNGGSEIDSITVPYGTLVDLTDYFTELNGYEFISWYADEELSEGITSIRMYGNKTVYAGWLENPFTDVTQSDWFHDDVLYVYANDLMQGTSATAFTPNGPTSRAMVVTVLWRMAGSPQADAVNTFSDVAAGQWYTEAINWAVANNITKGYGDGTFGINDPVSREQLAVFFYRYAQYTGCDITVRADLSGYPDANKISPWVEDAMSWAIGYGVINGRPSNILDPQGDAKRCEFAAMIHRFVEK